MLKHDICSLIFVACSQNITGVSPYIVAAFQPKRCFAMFWFNKAKEPERFYLLPGMGGRALRRKRKVFLIWSIVAGIITAAILATGLYFANLH
jgi:hypothetical protein